jgi:outer membrane protein assembly factor BamB
MPSEIKRFKVRQGVAANLRKFATLAMQHLGELLFSTDDGRLYVFDNSRLIGCSLNTAVCSDGEVVVSDGEVVWS